MKTDQHHHIVACHECDLLQTISLRDEPARYYCSRCGMLLRRTVRNGLDKALALSITGILLFTIANLFPFLSLNANGQIQEATLWSGSLELYRADQPLLAFLVLMTTIVFPLLDLAGTLFVLWPLKFGKTTKAATALYRWLRTLRPWGMLEIFMLGILVALVKLGDVATVIPDIALYSFGLLIFTLAATSYVTDPEWIWERLEAYQ